MAESIRPTKKQRELLDYIEKFIADNGYSPSYREIMLGCNYTSVATVALHVGSLIKRGHLRKRDHSARSLEVVAVAGDSKQTSADDNHEQWLVSRVKAHIGALEDTADDKQFEDARVLLDALRILGLSEDADKVAAGVTASRA